MKFLNPVLWAEEIDQLRAENERLKTTLCKYQHIASPEDRKVTRLITEIEKLKAELAEAKKDADRWQGLMTILQTAYSGSVQEFGEGYESLIIDCAMVSGYKTERRVQAVLSWRDVRDEPLDLATSLDKAIEAMKGK